jgi:signal peptidase
VVGVIPRSARRVTRTAATILAVLVVAVFVVQAVPSVIGADASYVVLSGSMEPEISAGDAVIVKSVDPADISSGAVITFVRSEESTPVTHRVVEVVDSGDSRAFRTKGDANDNPDPTLVPAANVTGEVWFVLPYVGHVVMFANTRIGMAVLVGAPVVAFILSEFYAFLWDETADEQPEPGESAMEVDEIDASAEAAADDTFTITTRDLQLSSVGFSALAVYSGYVAVQNTEPVSVAVFVGAAVVVTFIAAVFLASSEAPSASSQASEREVTDGGEHLSPPAGDTAAGGEQNGQ